MRILAQKALDIRLRLQDRVEHMRGHNRFVKADFADGSKTLYAYLRTHRNKYRRHVGAHFLMALYEAGPDVFEGFAEKHRHHGWHFDLTAQEQAALRHARDITSAHARISNLRYTTNVFEQLANSKQLLRMLGLGAVAGSAGILIGLGELFFFFRDSAKRIITDTIGIDIDAYLDDPADNDDYIVLAREITDGARNADGTLDATVVADGIQTLVETLEASGSAETAINTASGNTTYFIGILTGIIFLIIGRGLVKLVLEGVSGTLSKIDALIHDMDDYADWKLGRSAFPPCEKANPGSFIIPFRSGVLRPGDTGYAAELERIVRENHPEFPTMAGQTILQTDTPDTPEDPLSGNFSAGSYARYVSSKDTYPHDIPSDKGPNT